MPPSLWTGSRRCQSVPARLLTPSRRQEGDIITGTDDTIHMDTAIPYSARHGQANWTQTMRFTRRSIPAFLLPSLLSSFVYLATLVPEVDRGDCAELSLQAYQLGVTHPPGYPLHTVLGKAFTLLPVEPAFATNLLSAACTSLTVGLMGLLILHLTNDLLASVLVPLLFAFSPRIWSMAVTTEVYNVNLLFLSLAVWFLLIWYETSSIHALIGSAILLGLSLGTYLANILLLPAFGFLLCRGKGKCFVRSQLFVLVFGLIAVLTLSFSCFRSHAVTPIGTEDVPSSPLGALRYFTGEQYGTVAIHDAWFYLTRPIEHAAIFGRNFLWVGIAFGVLGVLHQWRTRRDVLVFFLLIFAMTLVYFTYYHADDYHYMVNPSYFIFSLWIAYGVRHRFLGHTKARVMVALTFVLLCAGLLIIQLPGKLERARSYAVTRSALSSLSKMPQNAVVISDWDEFTSLLYFQKTRRLREDVVLIERTTRTRHYDHGRVDGYLSYIDSKIFSRPIIIDYVEPVLLERFTVKPIDPTWFEIERPEP